MIAKTESQLLLCSVPSVGRMIDHDFLEMSDIKKPCFGAKAVR
jgi:hypothetical protein